ncbi:hypothetical protein IscW_ISCW016702 [Ixodes scapularis]|uniref:Uncharacterized protein n=1 Tax=Ixodes scapularis TaxID=6945 RepID=B7PAS6_IXOSC|nr:hypothetical protein IscW_ISCW016702 [Ixodes scapularis]|eukprot:XP_002407142.1 hypothetical protein IscW_ISCW016702 [Ixodes scapularis]
MTPPRNNNNIVVCTIVMITIIFVERDITNHNPQPAPGVHRLRSSKKSSSDAAIV